LHFRFLLLYDKVKFTHCSPVGDVISQHGIKYHQYAIVVHAEWFAAKPWQVGGSDRWHIKLAARQVDSVVRVCRRHWSASRWQYEGSRACAGPLSVIRPPCDLGSKAV